LGDISFRALEVLKSAALVACEDTRHSGILLSHYDIKKPLISYHKFNETDCSAKLIAEVKSGKNVALISDAGMPCISDPGAVLVSLAREAGVEMEVVPGPVALTSAMALSGIKTGFTFIGFLPEKAKDKKELLSSADKANLPIVLYVAPHDLAKTADYIAKQLGDRNVTVCRELTKLHETVTETTLSDFNAEERGEIVMIIHAEEKINADTALSVEEHLTKLLKEGMDGKSAVKLVASLRGIPKNEVYQVYISLN
jgi:16S rRNA (cytidine1402-2'-O)-methyltransferase